MKNSKKLTRNVIVLGLVSLCNDASSEMIYPLLPMFLMVTLGASAEMLGVIEGIAESTAAVLKLFSGWLSDKLKKRKAIIFSGYSLSAFTRPLMAVATVGWHVLFVRFGDRIGKGLRSAPRDAMIADSTDPAIRGKAFGFHRALFAVYGLFFGLTEGTEKAFVADLVKVEQRGTAYGVFNFAIGIGALPASVITVLLQLNNPEPKNSQNFTNYFRGVLKSINSKVIGLYCISMITFIILYGAYLTYYPILINKRFAGTPLVIGIIMSFMSLTTAGIASQLGKLVRYISEKKLILLSFTIYGLSLILIPFVQNLWMLLLPTLLFGIAHGINIPTIQTLLASMAPLEHRAAFMSLNGMVLRLGQTLGPLLIGLFFTLWGINGAFLLGALFALIAVGVTVLLIR